MIPDPPTALAEALTDFDSYLRARSDLTDYATVGTPAADDAAPVNPKLDTTTEKYSRPNGERYLPRKINVSGTPMDDVKFIRAAHNDGHPVLLYGPPGTGKTALLEAALPGLITVQGTVETEVADFVGSWVQRPDGTYVWVDGPLPQAMDAGKPMLVDEIALIDPRVMSVGYGTMDGRGELVVTANPERGIVKAKPGFLIFGAFNPDVPGALVSDALLSRFSIHVKVDTDWDLAKRLGVPRELITIARNLNLKHREGKVTAAPQLRELLTYLRVRETFGDDLALSNFVGQTHEEDRQIVREVVQSEMGRKTAPLVMGYHTT